MDKQYVRDFIVKLMGRNNWINGMYNYADGDLSAPSEYEDMFSKPAYFEDIDKLYDVLRKGYSGTFVWHNIVIFNHASDFGTFVYRMPKYERYEEHLTISAIEPEELKSIIAKISDGTYWNS